MKQQKKKKGRSVQELIGVRTFTKYGLSTNKGELLFYLVSPTNISVLSHTNIEIKIRHLMMVLSALPDIEIVCTDSSECFDDNKAYLTERLEVEENEKVRKLIKKDIDFLDTIQVEMATARQFFFVARLKGQKEKQVFETANRIESKIAGEGFEVHRLKKPEIKRILALYFEASMQGEAIPDIDGEQFYEGTDDEDEEKTRPHIFLLSAVGGCRAGRRKYLFGITATAGRKRGFCRRLTNCRTDSHGRTDRIRAGRAYGRTCRRAQYPGTYCRKYGLYRMAEYRRHEYLLSRHVHPS